MLFLTFINDVVDAVGYDVDAKISLFADDIAVWAQNKSIPKAAETVQIPVNRIVDWSRKWL